MWQFTSRGIDVCEILNLDCTLARHWRAVDLVVESKAQLGGGKYACAVLGLDYRRVVHSASGDMFGIVAPGEFLVSRVPGHHFLQ